MSTNQASQRPLRRRDLNHGLYVSGALPPSERVRNPLFGRNPPHLCDSPNLLHRFHPYGDQPLQKNRKSPKNQRNRRNPKTPRPRRRLGSARGLMTKNKRMKKWPMPPRTESTTPTGMKRRRRKDRHPSCKSDESAFAIDSDTPEQTVSMILMLIHCCSFSPLIFLSSRLGASFVFAVCDFCCRRLSVAECTA